VGNPNLFGMLDWQRTRSVEVTLSGGEGHSPGYERIWVSHWLRTGVLRDLDPFMPAFEVRSSLGIGSLT
jgi:hypothetical protein